MDEQFIITKLRKAQRISRRQLARDTGISYSTLASIETGCTWVLRSKTVQALSSYFQIPEREIRDSLQRWRQSLLKPTGA